MVRSRRDPCGAVEAVVSGERDGTRTTRGTTSRGPSYHHVAITGAAGAIGSALARAMRRAWPECSLALIDRDPEPLGRLARELGSETSNEASNGASQGQHHGAGGATVHVADLRDLDALPALVDTIEQAGPLEGLVNCAGVMKVQHVATWNWADARDLVTIDLLAPLRLQDLVVRGMCARGRGVIVNVASMAGRVPLRGAAYYGASKAGLAMASEIARADLAPHNVRVVTVYPGPVKSALEAGARADYGGGGLLGRFVPTGDPDELARRIMVAIAADQPRVIYPRLYQAGWAATNLASWFALSYGPPPVA
ncbi:MAG: SDR family NAD(P)-dependent oxidoreductase [Deltaproteobacteria bacterium]